jgi:hypothetical protein
VTQAGGLFCIHQQKNIETSRPLAMRSSSSTSQATPPPPVHSANSQGRGNGEFLLSRRNDPNRGGLVSAISQTRSDHASGVSPDRGLYTSIIGGIAVSALGDQSVSDRRSRRSVQVRRGNSARRLWCACPVTAHGGTIRAARAERDFRTCRRTSPNMPAAPNARCQRGQAWASVIGTKVAASRCGHHERR